VEFDVDFFILEAACVQRVRLQTEKFLTNLKIDER
jgi:hypothetical protein